MTYTPTDDRSKWPAEARKVAEDHHIPEGSWFYRVIDWPVKDAYDEDYQLPHQPRGERTWRWIRNKPLTGTRPNQKRWLFAQKWPEREGVIKSGGTQYRDMTLSTEVDETEAVA